MSLLSLSSDILILITSHLSAADLLILTQVSRKFHRHVSLYPFFIPVLDIISLGTRLWMVVYPPHSP